MLTLSPISVHFMCIYTDNSITSHTNYILMYPLPQLPNVHYYFIFQIFFFYQVFTDNIEVLFIKVIVLNSMLQKISNQTFSMELYIESTILETPYVHHFDMHTLYSFSFLSFVFHCNYYTQALFQLALYKISR